MQYSSWLCVKKPMCCPFISGNKSQREELDSILFIFEVSRTYFYFCETVPFSTDSCFNLFTAELWGGTIVSVVPYCSSVYILNFPRMDAWKKSLSQSIYNHICCATSCLFLVFASWVLMQIQGGLSCQACVCIYYCLCAPPAVFMLNVQVKVPHLVFPSLRWQLQFPTQTFGSPVTFA